MSIAGHKASISIRRRVVAPELAVAGPLRGSRRHGAYSTGDEDWFSLSGRLAMPRSGAFRAKGANHPWAFKAGPKTPSARAGFRGKSEPKALSLQLDRLFQPLSKLFRIQFLDTLRLVTTCASILIQSRGAPNGHAQRALSAAISK